MSEASITPETARQIRALADNFRWLDKNSKSQMRKASTSTNKTVVLPAIRSAAKGHKHPMMRRARVKTKAGVWPEIVVTAPMAKGLEFGAARNRKHQYTREGDPVSRRVNMHFLPFNEEGHGIYPAFVRVAPDAAALLLEQYTMVLRAGGSNGVTG
jgi:hypothetical protein